MTYMSLLCRSSITFYSCLAWFLLKLFATLLVGALCLTLALGVHVVAWAGVVAAGIYGVVLAHAYTTHAIILRGGFLTVRRGTFIIHEDDIPLLDLNYQLDQNIIGRILDVGTINLDQGGSVLQFRHVAQVRALCLVIQERQMLLQVLEQQRYVAPPVYELHLGGQTSQRTGGETRLYNAPPHLLPYEE